jgi:predicted alpha/beta superfamily hydrolase
MMNNPKKINQFLLLVILLPFVVHSQKTFTETIDSEELGTGRNLRIYLPPSYELDSTAYFPLTIVLDAEYLFDVYVGNSILFASRDKAPEQIIVGVDQNRYNERYEDSSYNEENSLPTEEGAAFYRFLKSELVDHMELNYRISPFKTLIGNTLTANFINYLFIEEYPSFSAFVNLNPHYATDMPVYVHNKAQTLKDEIVYYYMSSGPFMKEEQQELINATHELLNEYNNPKFRYQYDNFDNSTNVSSIGLGIPSALAFIYDVYSAISREEFDAHVKDLSPADAIAYLENKYVEIQYQFGTNLKIRESDIFAIESIVMDKENGDYLKSFGEMINRLYKKSPIGDYYIGMYYETGKKYRQALRYYKSGYMKLPKGDPNSDGYYENIERVLKKRDGLIVEEEEEIKN